MQQALETSALTVSAYSARIQHAVSSVGEAIVEGEVQKPKKSRSGLLYFDITDGDATLSCKVFKRQIDGLRHEPKDGDLVRITIDRPDFWPTAGKLDLIVIDVELAGVGELLRRRAALLEKLRAEGLCDPQRRKPLPAFPRAVGVIAGKDSEGMKDVVRALQDRLPHAYIVTCPALVQGKRAPRDVIDALAHLQEHPQVDVIVIARGGGSVQDLIAFDDERLCRAVFACAKPIVAAIGHTDNIPVCNYVTHAASTPSRSAEMVLPSLTDIRTTIASAQQALDRIPAQVEENRERLGALAARLTCSSLFEARLAGLRELGHQIANAETTVFARYTQGLAQANTALETVPHRCRAELAKREQGIQEQRVRLARAPQKSDEAIAGVVEQSRWIRDGIVRQLTDHQRDYGRAVDRLITTVHDAGLRRLEEERGRLAETALLARDRIAARLGGAEQDLKHITALIEARDFRRRGFVLATDAAGRPLSSIARVRVGATLNLGFRDGCAQARVEKIKEEEHDNQTKRDDVR
ncbi:MAG: exodeoxyribonuclease VII large subunit [Solirubrobacterales bacterium]